MPVKTLMTAEEFRLTGPETDACELVQGQIVPFSLPGLRAGEVCTNVAYLLCQHCRSLKPTPTVLIGSGIITQRNPDTVRSVDISVFVDPSWKEGPTPEGWSEEPPTLAGRDKSLALALSATSLAIFEL